MTLYHQTSFEAGQSILKTGFRLGHGGICGPAIYFSPTAKDTDVKAVGGRGFIIEATVDMGRMKHMHGLCDSSLTASKVKASDYDSITLDRGGHAECWFLPHCYEYIIYDPKRVLSMKGYPYSGWKSWFPAPAVPTWPYWPVWPGMQAYNSANTSLGQPRGKLPQPIASETNVTGPAPSPEVP